MRVSLLATLLLDGFSDNFSLADAAGVRDTSNGGLMLLFKVDLFSYQCNSLYITLYITDGTLPGAEYAASDTGGSTHRT